MRRILVAITCVLFSFTGASGQDWRGEFHRLLSTPDGPDRDSLIELIVSSAPDWREVINQIESLTFPDTTKGQVLMGTTNCLDGVERPYAIYVPSGYDPKTPTPMLVHLHGIVTRPNIDPDPSSYIGNVTLMNMAESRGWFALFPFGQKGAAWWDKVGMANVSNLVRTAKTNFNIDDDRVYLSGFSDGASAAFLFAMVWPSEFGAFVALNGTMGGGSEDGGFSTYATNMTNTYIYVTTADQDRQYPTAQMERTIDMAQRAGARILYRKLNGGHIDSEATIDYSEIFDYLQQHPRFSAPDTIQWETATREFGQCKWLGIDEVTIGDAATWYVDYNAALVDSSISIGFINDESFPGPGMLITAISTSDCLAKRVGLQPGDILIGGNGVVIDSVADFYRFRGTLKRGAKVELVVKRGDGELVLRGQMPDPRNYFIFNRTRPSAMLKAVHAGNRFDLHGSRVGKCHILVNPDMIELDKPVVVSFDNETIFEDVVVPDIGYLLRDFLSRRDRKMIYVTEISP